MPKTRRDRSVSYDNSRQSPLPCGSHHTKKSSSSNSPVSKEAMKEWEEAKCPVCIEHPHNAVLLICSSYEKGCRPYMCDTSYRHSNCFDQFCKSFAETPSTLLQETALNSEDSTPEIVITSETSTDGLQLQSSLEESNKVATVDIDLPNMRKLQEKLPCPLCRGQILGCTVMESARCFMNTKNRSCACETCEFNGNYTDLRKHARLEHPLVRPSEADPERQRSWRRLERQRDIGDVLSTIQSSFGEDESSVLPIEESSLLTVFLLIRVFRPSSDSSRSSSWSGGSRPRARFGIRTRPIRLRGENDDEETASSSIVLERDEAEHSAGSQSDHRHSGVVENDGNEAGEDEHESSEDEPAVWGRRVRRRITRSTPDNQL